MFDLLVDLLSVIGGLVVFAGAYYIHQRVRLTRTACVLAMVGGFMTYNGTLGRWVNGYASARGVAIITFVGVLIGICIIVADVKGKKKGADRPALFAFFFVPVFIVAFLASLPTVAAEFRGGVQKTTNGVQSQTR